MFTAALFIIGNKWKKPKRPSTDKWINKMWYIHSMGYYLAKKNELTWVNLKIIMFSERSQTSPAPEKNIYYMIPFILNSGKY